jgi:dCTP deaminase
MLKPDSWIRKMAVEQQMIEPFVDRQEGDGKVSFGPSSYGYDIRIADEYKIFTNVYGAVIDPKAFDPKAFVDHKGATCVVPPNSFALARTVERFKIPRNVLAVCLGKSTYARCGIIVNVTQGIAQLLFFEGTDVCETAYADRKGKYQNQVGVVPPRILQPR